MGQGRERAGGVKPGKDRTQRGGRLASLGPSRASRHPAPLAVACLCPVPTRPMPRLARPSSTRPSSTRPTLPRLNCSRRLVLDLVAPPTLILLALGPLALASPHPRSPCFARPNRWCLYADLLLLRPCYDRSRFDHPRPDRPYPAHTAFTSPRLPVPHHDRSSSLPSGRFALASALRDASSALPTFVPFAFAPPCFRSARFFSTCSYPKFTFLAIFFIVHYFFLLFYVDCPF